MRNELLTTLKSAIKANMFSYCNNRILSWHLGRQMYSPCCRAQSFNPCICCRILCTKRFKNLSANEDNIL